MTTARLQGRVSHTRHENKFKKVSNHSGDDCALYGRSLQCQSVERLCISPTVKVFFFFSNKLHSACLWIRVKTLFLLTCMQSFFLYNVFRHKACKKLPSISMRTLKWKNVMIFNNILNVSLTKILQLVCSVPEFSAAFASLAFDRTDEKLMQKRSYDVHEPGQWALFRVANLSNMIWGRFIPRPERLLGSPAHVSGAEGRNTIQPATETLPCRNTVEQWVPFFSVNTVLPAVS